MSNRNLTVEGAGSGFQDTTTYIILHIQLSHRDTPEGEEYSIFEFTHVKCKLKIKMSWQLMLLCVKVISVRKMKGHFAHDK